MLANTAGVLYSENWFATTNYSDIHEAFQDEKCMINIKTTVLISIFDVSINVGCRRAYRWMAISDRICRTFYNVLIVIAQEGTLTSLQIQLVYLAFELSYV